MTELICFVNPDGTPTGETAPKLEAHNAETKLHLAFSSYIFNNAGDVLVTRRALGKKVWPGVWTNSCCGHPAPGEEMEAAIARRLEFELGMQATDVTLVLADYTYKAPAYNGIVEYEFCPVYFARAASQPAPNPEEVMDWKWMSWQELLDTVAADAADYALPAGTPGAAAWSWWCKDQLTRLAQSHAVHLFAK